MFKIRIFQKNMTIICIYSVCVRAKTDFTPSCFTQLLIVINMDWVAKLCYMIIFIRSQMYAFWMAEAPPLLASLPISFVDLISSDKNDFVRQDNDGKLTRFPKVLLP